MSEARYKLDELAKAAGTSPRTVRYYVQRGLLPPPAFRGKDSAYSREHLLRLRAIRRLQDAYLPLDAIAAQLEGKSIDEIERVAEANDAPTVIEAAPAPEARPQSVSETAWRRIAIAPGLELHVQGNAPPDTNALAASILNVISSLRKGA